MTPRVAEFLQHSGAVADIGPATRLSAIKMRNSTWQGGSLVSLLFLEDQPVPRYVLRVPRAPARDERVASNFAALQALSEIEPLRGTVPVPVFSGYVEGVLISLETFLDGASLAVEIGQAERQGDSKCVANLLKRACDWLWRLHQETWTEPLPDFSAQCLADIALIQERKLLSETEIESLLRHIAPVRECPGIFARAHGDFNPNNLLLPPADYPLGVVDWEHSTPGCALFDLFQLITIALLFPISGTEERVARAESLWAGPDLVGEVYRAALERYADHARLPSNSLRPLFAVYLSRMAADLLRLFGDRPEPMRAFWRDLIRHEIHA
jgi:aminoglycoside phosphotransferase (APT) family kinase protein